MNSLENICPVCKHKNELEAVFCSRCGTSLADPFADPGAKTRTDDMPAHAAETIQEPALKGKFGEAVAPAEGIAIFLEGIKDPVFVDSRGEFVIGRKSDTTSEGLFDLSPFGGYHLGLSRRHAVIRRMEHGYELRDLGSANGTWLNGERLVPHTPYPLPSSAHLRLGRMRLFVLYRPFANS